MPAPTQLDRITLTKTQIRATEIMLYRTADLIDRLLADNGVQYTKIVVPASPQHIPYAAPNGLTGVPPGVPITPASSIVPQGGQ